MTDKQIITILECCASDENIECCKKCALCEKYDCYSEISQNALDLIKRQKAEIERLEKENAKQKAMLEAIDNEMLPLPFETDFDKAIKTAKSEAIKEFAERLKEKYYNEFEFNPRTNKRYIPTKKLKASCDWILHEVVPSSIDNLVKEMMEVEK